MPKKPAVLILHAYSGDNLGDGLLVELAIQGVRESLRSSAGIDFTVLAAYPESFKDEGIRFISSKPSSVVELRCYLRTLKSVRSFDLVVGVGGGYLRAAHLREAAKALVLHGPQLVAASFAAGNSVYLPQSIGPIPFLARKFLRGALGRVGTVMARDDRSVVELGSGLRVRREVDLALGLPRKELRGPITGGTVLSVRNVDGGLPCGVLRLANRLKPFDGYVQSSVSNNDDREAMARLSPAKLMTKTELIMQPDGPRVVVAVRLHAALMAIAAGHYVVHLAYERKGFGAFADLGLDEYVYNVRQFDDSVVANQVTTLRESSIARANYDRRILTSQDHVAESRRRVREAIVDAYSAGAQGRSDNSR